MNGVLPPEQRKPVYLMEFGIRGLGTCGTKPAKQNTYYAADPTCPEIWRTGIAGFQQLWFAIGSAQLGFTGASKWDAYWGVYDRTLNPPQVYWTVGPPTEGSPLMPSYYALALLFHTTVPGWQVVRVDPWDETDWAVATYGIEGHSSKDTPEKELAAYVGPAGELTSLGLDTNGRALNGVSDGPAGRVQRRWPPAEHELQARVLERLRRRDELGRGDRADERGRRRPLRGPAPRGLRADDGAGVVTGTRGALRRVPHACVSSPLTPQVSEST